MDKFNMTGVNNFKSPKNIDLRGVQRSETVLRSSFNNTSPQRSGSEISVKPSQMRYTRPLEEVGLSSQRPIPEVKTKTPDKKHVEAVKKSIDKEIKKVSGVMDKFILD